MFEILETQANGTVIKVIGVGGAGGNAVDHMIRNGVGGVEFVSANTDAQALSRTLSKQHIQLGGSGLGAPRYGGGLAEVVHHPRYATAMGLLMEGKSQLERGILARQSGTFKATFRRMREWFQKNF